MAKWVLLWILGFVLVGIESFYTTATLVLAYLVLVYIFTKQGWVFGMAFVLGLLLDVLLVRRIGATSLFFVVWLLVTMLYERKFEVRTLPFVMLVTFTGTLCMGFFIEGEWALSHAFLSALFAAAAFAGIVSFGRKKEERL